MKLKQLQEFDFRCTAIEFGEKGKTETGGARRQEDRETEGKGAWIEKKRRVERRR